MCFRVAIVSSASYFVVDDKKTIFFKNMKLVGGIFFYFKFVDVILKAAGDFKPQQEEKE